MDILSFLLGYESGKGAESGGEGRPWVVANGTFTPTQKEDTITHNLGVVPDLLMVWATKTPSNAGSIVFMSGYSDAVANKAASPKAAACSVLMYDNYNNKYYANTAYNAVSFSHSGAVSYGYPHNATETEIAVGSTTMFRLEAGLEYAWLAIGGIF